MEYLNSWWLRVSAITSTEKMSRSFKTALSRAVFCVLEAGKGIEVMDASLPISSMVGFLLAPLSIRTLSISPRMILDSSLAFSSAGMIP